MGLNFDWQNTLERSLKYVHIQFVDLNHCFAILKALKMWYLLFFVATPAFLYAIVIHSLTWLWRRAFSKCECKKPCRLVHRDDIHFYIFFQFLKLLLLDCISLAAGYISQMLNDKLLVVRQELLSNSVYFLFWKSESAQTFRTKTSL